MCAKEREFGGREWMTFHDKVIEAAAHYGVDANLLLRKNLFAFLEYGLSLSFLSLYFRLFILMFNIYIGQVLLS